MSIDEYKNSLITILENMEKEHGCIVKSVAITKEVFNGWPCSYTGKRFHVEIEL